MVLASFRTGGGQKPGESPESLLGGLACSPLPLSLLARRDIDVAGLVHLPPPSSPPPALFIPHQNIARLPKRLQRPGGSGSEDGARRPGEEGAAAPAAAVSAAIASLAAERVEPSRAAAYSEETQEWIYARYPCLIPPKCLRRRGWLATRHEPDEDEDEDG